MTLLRLFFEFAKVGLFSVGGGLATIPFLQRMGEATGWFTNADLTMMVAVSESTPGPIGINMATYVGYLTAGLPGAIVAVLGEITPCIAVILIIAGMLQKFRQSRAVEWVFYGMRPASTALIASACLSLAVTVFLLVGGAAEHTVSVHWPAAVLCVCVFLALQHKKMKDLHPVVFIGISALIGVVLQF